MTPWRLCSNIDHDLVLGTVWLIGEYDDHLRRDGVIQIPKMRYAPIPPWGERLSPTVDLLSVTLALKIYQDRKILVMDGASVRELETWHNLVFTPSLALIALFHAHPRPERASGPLRQEILG